MVEWLDTETPKFGNPFCDTKESLRQVRMRLQKSDSYFACKGIMVTKW